MPFSLYSGFLPCLLPGFSVYDPVFLLGLWLYYECSLEELPGSPGAHENEDAAMSKMRLLIKRPGRENTCIPVIVDRREIIGNCISSLVDHLGFPRRDSLGRPLAYTLRPLSGGPPLSNTTRFSEACLLPETRLVLEVEEAYAPTRPLSPSTPGNSLSGTKSPPSTSRPIMNRRTFVASCALTACAVSGLFAGLATAFATRKSSPSGVMTPPTPSLPTRLQQSLLFSAHQQTVRAVTWSPDGSLLASGADDGWLLIWTPDGQVQQRISHPAGVAALAWEPSGKVLASGSGISVRFFDVYTGTPLAPARSAHTGQVSSLAWSQAAGQPLVSGSLDRRAIVWDTQTFQPQAVFTRHTAAIDALSFQPDGSIVASASQGGAVRVWRVDTLTEVHSFYQDAPIPMRAVAFVPAGTLLAVGGEDGQVRLWDNGLVCQHSTPTAQGKICVDMPLRFQAHPSSVRSLSWSLDSQFLATGGEDGAFAVWTSPPGGIPTLVAKTASDHPVVGVAWSPTRRQVAVASGKTVTVWSLG